MQYICNLICKSTQRDANTACWL